MRFGVISLALASSMALAIAGGTVAGTNPDTDSDGQFQLVDNCLEDANNGQAGTGPAQNDYDRDGFGNICDADFNNTGTVNVTDFNFFIGCFNQPVTNFVSGISCNNMDMNGSGGNVNVTDFNFFIGDFLASTLGPSGLPCAFKAPSTRPNLTGRIPCEYDPDGSGPL